eukprot:14586259-Ditylum_brightwellii.AAC.1
MKFMTYLKLSILLVVFVTKPICVKATRMLGNNVFDLRGNEVADWLCQGSIDSVFEDMQTGLYYLTDNSCVSTKPVRIVINPESLKSNGIDASYPW